MRSLDQIEIQCFKSASQLCMLDLVKEMIVGCASNCVDKYEYIKLDAMLNSLKSFFDESL